MMLVDRRSPGPPWLPVAQFANTATLVGGAIPVQSITVFVMVDRRFRLLSATPWTVLESYGLRLGAGVVAVPNGAQWWAVGVSQFGDEVPMPPRPWEAYRVRWGLHV